MLAFNDFKREVQEAGLVPVEHKPDEHWAIRGGAYIVHYYPNGKRGSTCYINGTRRGFRDVDVSFAIRAAKDIRQEAVAKELQYLGSRPGGGSRKTSYARARRRLLLRDNRCHWCGRELAWSDSTIDHRIPLGKGGSNGNDNLVLSCEPCNRAKGCKLPRVRRVKNAD